MSLAAYIDHTLLKPETLLPEIEKLCAEALQWGFASVCVPPYFVGEAKKRIAGSGVKVATVIGFPFGYSHYSAKVAEIKKAIEDGTDELDIVVSITAIVNGDRETLEAEIKAVTAAVDKANVTLKLILETGILTDEQIIGCCELYQQYPVQFLKTSTGYAAKGATVEAVKLMRQHLPAHMQIKASGGIRDAAFAQSLFDAGATRLGCSASVAIVNGSKSKNSY